MVEGADGPAVQVAAEGTRFSSATPYLRGETLMIEVQGEEKEGDQQEHQRALKEHVSCCLLQDFKRMTALDHWDSSHLRIPLLA